ncbi:MAG: class I SAM-dependent methyltransferase [Marmoricola sp.]
MGRWSRLVAPRFLDWLNQPEGLRWADVGCGSGALTAAVVERCSPGSVLGVDPSAAQVEEAARRVVDPRVRFERGSADDLTSASFDVVVSGLVLNFVPDPVTAVASMARAAPGGVVAAYVWDYAEGMQLLRTFWDVAGSLDPVVADLNEGHRFSWSRPDALAEMWTSAGLRDVRSTPVTVPTVFEDFSDFWSPFLGGQGPAPGYVATLGDPAREELREALERVLAPEPDGRIRLTARAWAVRGTSSDGLR